MGLRCVRLNCSLDPTVNEGQFPPGYGAHDKGVDIIQPHRPVDVVQSNTEGRRDTQ